MLPTLLILALVAAVAWLGWTWNRLVSIRAAMQAAWASVDALLKRRFDLIPNLVELVRGTMSYEADTLTAITAARSGITTDDVVARSRAESTVTQGVRQLLALVENYPQLRANENILRLQHQLVETEDDIAKARRYFNAVVRDHNILCQSFPTVIVARLFGFEPSGYFSAEDDERDAPEAKLMGNGEWGMGDGAAKR